MTALFSIPALFRRCALFDLRWRHGLWWNVAWRNLEWCALLATTTLLNVSANRRLHSRCRRRDWHRYRWHRLAALIAIATLLGWQRYRCYRYCLRSLHRCGLLRLSAFATVTLIAALLRCLRRRRCQWHGSRRRC